MGLTTRDVGRTREELVNHEPGEVFPFLVFPFPISGFPLPGFPVPDFFSSSFPVPEFPAPAFPVPAFKHSPDKRTRTHLLGDFIPTDKYRAYRAFFWSVDVILN